MYSIKPSAEIWGGDNFFSSDDAELRQVLCDGLKPLSDARRARYRAEFNEIDKKIVAERESLQAMVDEEYAKHGDKGPSEEDLRHFRVLNDEFNKKITQR